MACKRLLVRKIFIMTEFAEVAQLLTFSDSSLCSFSEDESAECDTLEYLRGRC
jgi:hypothetical protein